MYLHMLIFSPIWDCPACYPDTLASSISMSPHYPWAVILSCCACGLKWIVCKECFKNRKHLRSHMDILQHHHDPLLWARSMPTATSTSAPVSGTVTVCPNTNLPSHLLTKKMLSFQPQKSSIQESESSLVQLMVSSMLSPLLLFLGFPLLQVWRLLT